jgi:hypothetical protein
LAIACKKTTNAQGRKEHTQILAKIQTNYKQTRNRKKQDGGVRKNKVVATAQGNSIGQANLEQLARETITSNLLPAVVPGGAEMGVGFED